MLKTTSHPPASVPLGFTTGSPTATEPLGPVVTTLLYDIEFRFLYEDAYRVAYRILGNRDDAGDIARTTMAKAWLRWDSISTDGPVWVALTSGHTALGIVRRRRLFDRLPFVSASSADAPSLLRDDLVRALRQLSPRQHDVLLLRFVADLPEADVAAALGCSVGSVRQHTDLGLQALRSNSILMNTNPKEDR